MVVKHMNCLCTQHIYIYIYIHTHIYRMGQASTNKIQNNAKIMHTKLEKQASNPIREPKIQVYISSI